jgi:hypothetical protein
MQAARGQLAAERAAKPGVGFLHEIEWSGFFDRERPPPEFTIPVLVPKGRQTVVFAAKKLGKSLLALDAAAAATTGRSVLGSTPRAPVSAVYLDLEMTEDDVYARLVDLGYGPEHEEKLARNFHYYLLPVLPPLDTAAGGEALLDLVRQHDAEVVVIDTTSRVISGGENESDTFHALYRHTGLRLKKSGVGLLRLDHTGKDADKGQRGSSAKDTDVDTVYSLTKRSDGKLLLAHKGITRIPWMPDNVVIERQVPLRHVVADGGSTAAAEEIATLLDQLGAEPNTSARAAVTMLRLAHKGRRTKDVNDAVKLRQSRLLEAS